MIPIDLRLYQETGINEIRGELAKNRSVLYCLPTGGGKTIVFCYIANSALLRGKRVFILVHRDNLLEQASQKLASFGIPHGRIGGSRSRTRDLIQVASVQTLVRRLDQVDPPDLIIVDEGHHLTRGTQWGKIVERFPFAKLIGVTATPIRLDGKGLGADFGGYYESMVIGPTIQDLIADGYLSRPYTYRPPSDIDLTSIKMVAGDYDKKELIKRKNKSHIVGDSIEYYKKLAEGKPAICFEISVDAAKETAEKYKAAGYNFVSIDGSQDRRFIRKTIDDLSEGRIQGIVSCDLISEGTDVPVVEVGIFLRPTWSLSLYLQQAGRILRAYPGKTKAILLDHVGNSQENKHGLPEQERTWSLAGQPKRKRGETEDTGEKITQCPSCYFCYPSDLGACPSCSTIKPINKRELERIEGELVLAQHEIKKQEERREIGKARTLDELKAIARSRGYHAKWAEHIFNARQRKQGVNV